MNPGDDYRSMKPTEPEDFRELEIRDEEQILSEIKGDVVKEMFYEFPSGGRTVVGISWVGIKEIARQYKGIDVKLEYERDIGDAWLVVVKAVDVKNGYGMLGSATQSKMMDIHDLDEDKRWVKNSDGSWKMHKEPDPFVIPKAFSKAQRNAIRALIPETFFAEMYKKLKESVGKSVAPPPPKKVEASPVVKLKSALDSYDDLTRENIKRIVKTHGKTEGEVIKLMEAQMAAAAGLLTKEAASHLVETELARAAAKPGFKSAVESPQLPEGIRFSESAIWKMEGISKKYDQPLEVVQQMVFRHMFENPEANESAAADAIERHYAEISKPVEAPEEGASVEDQLDEENVDVTLLDFTINEDGATIVKPKKFLGDLWGPVNDAVKSIGGTWFRDGKNSHWKVPPPEGE